MITEKNRAAAGHTASALVALVWGTTFISSKKLLVFLSPSELILWRFLLAFVILTLIFPHRLKFAGIKRELYLVLAALFGVAVYFVAETYAIKYTYTSNVSVILSAAPFFTAVISRLVFREEKLSVGFFAGFLTAMVGIVMISVDGSVSLSLSPKGDLLALAAAASWGTYSVLLKKIEKFDIHPIQLTRRIFFYGLILMLPICFITDFRVSNITALCRTSSVIHLLYLGFLASAICYILWNFSVKHIGPVKTANYIYAQPVVTLIFSTFLLNEQVTPIRLAGTAITIAGLIISVRKK